VPLTVYLAPPRSNTISMSLLTRARASRRSLLVAVFVPFTLTSTSFTFEPICFPSPSAATAVTLSSSYQGIEIFQDRNSTAPISLSGKGAMTITGILYAAKATLNVTGNGGLDAQGNPLTKRFSHAQAGLREMPALTRPIAG
jgi:ABC-type nitrate/sulfonate/bicarbonate transport system permease component